MRELVYLCAQPNDFYYSWQCHLWLESLKERGESNKAVLLIFVPKGRENNNKHWDSIINLYPEAKFHFYEATHNMNPILSIYIPIIRPYILLKHFEKYPELKEKAIFYCDCDILFTEKFDIDKYIDDDICYLSNTNSYINASYFNSKYRVHQVDDKDGKFKKGDPVDAKKETFEEFKKIDVLDETCKISGINRQIAEKYNLHSGGAQYLLKNIDVSFWNQMMTNTLKIRRYLQEINRQYFESESKGWQSWCADMWGILHLLWYRGIETKVIDELNFAWTTDVIKKLETCPIFHNAGAVGELQGDIPIFYKGKYHAGSNPFKDPKLEELYNNEKNKQLCNHFYVEKLLDLKNKYSL